MAERVVDPVSSKTSEEALEFVRKMQEAFPKTPRSKTERAALQKYLAKFTEAELRAVGRRVLSDLMQRPPRTIKAGDLPPEPPARPEPHGPHHAAERSERRNEDQERDEAQERADPQAHRRQGAKRSSSGPAVVTAEGTLEHRPSPSRYFSVSSSSA